MSTVIVWTGTALAAVIVVLTYLRLRGGDRVAGRFQISHTLATTHLATGLVALVLWAAFLLAPSDSPLGGELIGIVALAAWWVTTLCGLLILTRWLPARGRHVTRPATDNWSDGAGLSLLAHGGMLVIVLGFTWAYLTALV